jgi:hypothetical protein
MHAAARLGLIVTLAASACVGRTAHAEGEGERAVLVIAALVDEIAAAQDPRVAVALQRVDDLDKRLLALRSYLRSASHLAERWSWTEEQIAAWHGSPEQRELEVAIAAVRVEFTRRHQGHELWVNPQVRSLDIQLRHWNENASVAAAAAATLAAALNEVDSVQHRQRAPDMQRTAFQRWLATFVPEPAPTVAAPGLSPHGQMRAVDFQVHRNGKVVAGPSSATIAETWDGDGWAQALETAVRAAGDRFVGPLMRPREPWHYDFQPIDRTRN